MKINTLLLLCCSAIFICLFSACSEDVQVNFFLNGNDLNASDTQPAPDDSLLVMSIKASDTIFITDVSTPSGSIKSRLWDLDGDGIWDSRFKDQEHFSTTFDQEGLYKITFCANGEKNCITKWIKVEPEIIIPDFTRPVLTFVKPDSYYSKSKSKYYDVQVQTENIFSKDELSLQAGEKPIKFNFDEETGVVTARKIRLSSGENKIELQANTGDGIEATHVMVEYGTKSKQENSSANTGNSNSRKPTIPPPPPPPPTQKPLVQILYTDTKPVNTRQLDVQVLTDYYNGKRLDVTLNGVPQTKYRFSNSRNAWIVSLDLQKGQNNLAVSVTNEAGRTSANTLITYDTPKSTTTTPVTPAPVTNTKVKPPSTPCAAGIPASQHASYSQDCIALYTKNNYEVKLYPKQRVDLVSFYIYANDCGGVEVTLSGDGDTQRFKSSLTKGRSQVLFSNIDARLEGGKNYTLTLKPLGNYQGCGATAAPRLEKVTDCGMSQKSCSALQLNQDRNPILYDLKILY